MVSTAAGRLRAVEPALLLLAAMVFIVQVGVAVMLPLLPLYARSLGASPFVLGLLTSSFAVTNALGQLVTGFLAEPIQLRRLLAGGIGSYAVANFMIAAASTAGLLIAFRSLAGVGGGVMLVGERLYLAQLVDQSRLAFANGILSAAASAGSVAGPAFGGLLASLADLRLPFILVGVTSVAGTIAAWFLPRARAGVGRTTAAVTATAIEAADPLAQPVMSTIAGSRGERALWRHLSVLLLVQLALNSGFGAFITTYGPFAQERLGWSTAQVGFVFALFGIGSILLGPWLGRQADLRGRRDIAILGTVPVLLFAIAYFLELPWPVLYLVSVLAGGGLTVISAAWFALLADATESGRRGRRFGLIAALSNLGIVIGATITALIWQSTGDARVGFAVAAVSVVLCAAFLFALPRNRPVKA
jgi:MFS family permease